MKNFIFIIIIVAILVSCSMRENKGKDNVKEQIEKLDSLKGSFSPSYVNDAENTHIGLDVEFKNGQFNIIPSTLSIRPGRVPYSDGDISKPFILSFKDINAKDVFTYSIIHPGLRRVCEAENPKSVVENDFIFEILMPANRGITSFQLANKDSLVFDFKLPPIRQNQDSIRLK